MDIQTTLTLMIQAVVMGIVTLMIFDFISGLWVVPLPPVGWQPPVIEPPTVSAFQPVPTPQQEIPDPWSLEASPHHSAPAPAVILPFPTLRLLPPVIAQQVQPTRKSKAAKSSTPRKGASTPKSQSTKSRKITA
ncbi:hypothetical protein NIES2111_62920 (plasmid) [Nostoc sp. NIES-2111]|nr:hypothetical protein NIES2111_62920 [Nostoc sp. NIES-2111]